jgi:hypothetical protein
VFIKHQDGASAGARLQRERGHTHQAKDALLVEARLARVHQNRFGDTQVAEEAPGRHSPLPADQTLVGKDGRRACEPMASGFVGAVFVMSP